MATQEKLVGNWNQFKGKVKQRWGQLTDDELSEVEGNFDQLVGLIQQKTGEARQQIERALNEFSDQAGGAFSQARQYVDQAGETLRGAADQIRERTREGYEEAQQMFRRRPAESVAVAFGTGLVVGLLVGLIAGSRD